MNTVTFVTRDEFRREHGDLAEEMGQLRGLIGNFLAEQRNFLVEQQRRDRLFADQLSVLAVKQRESTRARRKLDSKTEELEDGVEEITRRTEVREFRAELARRDSIIRLHRSRVGWALKIGAGIALVVVEEIVRHIAFK